MRVDSRCGRRAWLLDRALNDVISGQCVFKTSLPCFRSFFEVATS